MENPIILKTKKEKVIQVVNQICSIKYMPVPEINFEICPFEQGGQLAHSHPYEYKICISERQLKLQNFTGLEETVYHEMTHLLGQVEHGSEFREEQRELTLGTWRPPSGVTFISGEQVLEKDKKLRELEKKKEEEQKRNEEARLKAPKKTVTQKAKRSKVGTPAKAKRKKKVISSGARRRTDYKAASSLSKVEESAEVKIPEQPIESKETAYRGMSEEEKRRSREKLGINVDDKSHIKPKKKRGVFDKLRMAFGLD